ncbi:interferon-induced GTP-binding protein Mx2-like isoform X2 [Bufo bufo]|uniref:interferon-induced GTP-binding protein Mx2-like isoform X2 n=1 Tax=Bufo bufo TaxID=8384 RepID=UPI001ABEE480|nr:interferon-induced GTP-binding protein Mx2-like isoform X2 [Bufo bufo]
MRLDADNDGSSQGGQCLLKHRARDCGGKILCNMQNQRFPMPKASLRRTPNLNALPVFAQGSPMFPQDQRDAKLPNRAPNLNAPPVFAQGSPILPQDQRDAVLPNRTPNLNPPPVFSQGSSALPQDQRDGVCSNLNQFGQLSSPKITPPGPSMNTTPNHRPVYDQGLAKSSLSLSSLSEDNWDPKLLDKQYKEKIRPCIDIIDSLRSLGVEKDLELPAIAVIGDQSSGKSSVLEALSGVNLPRGTGIVTRCPLELKLKKSPVSTEWSGTISYKNKTIPLSNPSAVEQEVRRAQDCIAGHGEGIKDELITLEIIAPNVPDLTLIDLPGITRINLPNQPRDIGDQIRQMIKKYISRQETINLAVVPCNVDIVTTEVLEMSREVDPSGERTIGVLTKPDLVDKGAEGDVVKVAQNCVYSLIKGYVLVKCRSQMEIQNNVNLKNALINEKVFFEQHEHYSVFLRKGNATIPCLAEKLSKELVNHIARTLPGIDYQVKIKLREAENHLNQIGRGVPDTKEEQIHYLLSKIQAFTEGISKVINGDEEGSSQELNLFLNLRRLFNIWEKSMQDSCAGFVKELKNGKRGDENQYRGRELMGFINYRKFENILRNHIMTFQEPAVCLLRSVTELINNCFMDVSSSCFLQFHNLHEASTLKIQEISHEKREKAEETIKLQFGMEKIIHCQDTLYCETLHDVRRSSSTDPQVGQGQLMDELTLHLKAYFQNTMGRLSNQIPLIIQHYVLHEFTDELQSQMYLMIKERENTNLLDEKDSLCGERKKLKDRIQRLTLARKRLADFSKLV